MRRCTYMLIASLVATVTAGAELPVDDQTSTASQAKVVSELLQKVSRVSKADHIRRGALTELSQMGTNAAAAVPALIRIAESPEARSRTHVIRALGKIGAPSALIVPSLAKIIESTEDKYVIRHTAYALGDIGATASNAVPALITAGRSEAALRNGERGPVATALGRIGPGASRAIPLLADYMQDRHYGEVRASAAIALLRIAPEGQHADEAIAMLVNAFERSFPFSRRPWIADQMATLGPVSTNFLPALRRTENHHNEDIRRAASNAVVKISQNSQDARIPRELTRISKGRGRPFENGHSARSPR